MPAWLVFQTLWYGLVNGTAYVAFAVGLTLIFGVMDVIYLAHGEGAMLGAMVTYSLLSYLGVPYFLAAPLAIAVVGASGVIFNRLTIQPLIRTPTARYSIILATMGLSYILLHTGIVVWGSLPFDLDSPLKGTIQVGGVVMGLERIMLFVLTSAAIIALHLILNKSGLGKRMRATAQSLTGASLVGINTGRVYDYTMVISTALAALGGILLGTIWTASAHLGQFLLVKGFAIVIMAGIGNVPGTVVMGLVIGLVEALFGLFISSYYKEAFVYGVMIVVIVFKPEGIFPRR